MATPPRTPCQERRPLVPSAQSASAPPRARRQRLGTALGVTGRRFRPDNGKRRAARDGSGVTADPIRSGCLDCSGTHARSGRIAASWLVAPRRRRTARGGRDARRGGLAPRGEVWQQLEPAGVVGAVVHPRLCEPGRTFGYLLATWSPLCPNEIAPATVQRPGAWRRGPIECGIAPATTLWRPTTDCCTATWSGLCNSLTREQHLPAHGSAFASWRRRLALGWTSVARAALDPDCSRTDVAASDRELVPATGHAAPCHRKWRPARSRRERVIPSPRTLASSRVWRTPRRLTPPTRSMSHGTRTVRRRP
jgi:hypothetical protein